MLVAMLVLELPSESVKNEHKNKARSRKDLRLVLPQAILATRRNPQ
jgi:hypothetical protein